MTSKNELYYMVGLSGSGKTVSSQKLVSRNKDAVCFSSSQRLHDFLKEKGFGGWSTFNELQNTDRQSLINELHSTFALDKEANTLTIVDGHMWVENPVQGVFCNAMALDNMGISNGLIFLSTPSEIIATRVKSDNSSGKRRRAEVSIKTIQERSESEFTAAEDYCLSRGLKFAVLNNERDGLQHSIDDVEFISQYQLNQSASLRSDYHYQFDTLLTPSKLRQLHQSIGEKMYHSFSEGNSIDSESWQVIGVPRSGNLLTYGFTHDFDGPLLFDEGKHSTIKDIDQNRNTVIIDSVIHSGETLKRVLESFPSNYKMKIHVVCLAINIAALPLLKELSSSVSFHCCGFSNKEDRPMGQSDMGARLFGTLN